MKSPIQHDPADKTAPALSASVRATIQHLIEYIDVFCNSSLEGIVVLDRKARILYLNPAASTIFAATNQDCLGRNIWHALPDLAHDFKDRIELALNSPETNLIKGEYPSLQKSLSMRVKQSAQNIFLFVQEINPVSEDALHNTQQAHLLDSIVANMSDGVIVTDQQGQILFFNPAAENISGFKADELMGQTVNLFVEPEIEDKDNVFVRMIESMQGHEATDRARHIHIQTKDSARFPVEMTLSKTALDGEALFICIVKDKRGQYAEKNMTEEPVEEDAVLISTLLEEEPDLIDLIEVFLEQYPSYIERCKLQFTRQDWSALADTLHSLVGMAGGYGYPIITDTARLAETELKKRNYAHISEYLHKLERFNTMAQRGYQRP